MSRPHVEVLWFGDRDGEDLLASGTAAGASGCSVDADRSPVLAALQKCDEDLLLILDQLRQGIVMTDCEGRITFVNQACRQLLGESTERIGGSRWAKLCPLELEDEAALQAMARCAPDRRSRIPVRMHTASGRRFSMEVEILDVPRDPERKILFIYDMTEAHDPRRLPDEERTFHGLVGQSEAMRLIYQQIRDLAMVDATVLIEGETGTGKERVAQAIHAAGHRSGKLCVPVNCAGMTESLIGSQLFGHRRGAFTGAVADHHGVFETANGGTVFLDEIGDIPLSMQTNLLRVLQEREITRLGESKPRPVDVRVIAATHQDLDQLVREAKFRLDLLYRIRVARIVIPPLREHREDIPLLVESFLADVQRRINKSVAGLSDGAMRRLMLHDWPGNVRELQSAIEAACIACKASVIQEGDLPPELNGSGAPGPAFLSPLEDARNHVLAAIRAANGNRTAAARLLGVSRATLYRRLRELNLETGGRLQAAGRLG